MVPGDDDGGGKEALGVYGLRGPFTRQAEHGESLLPDDAHQFTLESWSLIWICSRDSNSARASVRTRVN